VPYGPDVKGIGLPFASAVRAFTVVVLGSGETTTEMGGVESLAEKVESPG
jgi:hypothetical protein